MNFTIYYTFCDYCKKKVNNNLATITLEKKYGVTDYPFDMHICDDCAKSLKTRVEAARVEVSNKMDDIRKGLECPDLSPVPTVRIENSENDRALQV